ncbi:uncharacterized protein M6B38_155300 [Iris pallida]|uniref:Uncharacterized protein n=1 Tax=Iris pallida TaxID=29817 RepID=A0AAX6F463_IRIPA|nr:uncharacterized protein M6B38_155300 [Iris pallida]
MADEKKPKVEETKMEHTKQQTPPLSPPLHPHDLLYSLFNCRSCGCHFPAKSPSQPPTNLQTLESQWRVVLLCDACLLLVRTAAVCSYCFSPVAVADPFLDCLRCSRRVHVGCVPAQRRLFGLDLHNESFACVDCCPLSRPRSKKAPGFSVTKVMVEELAREAERKGGGGGDGEGEGRGEGSDCEGCRREGEEGALCSHGAHL